MCLCVLCGIVDVLGCSLCGAGSAQAREGESECTLCPPGTYTSTNGSQTCTECESGTYLSERGGTQCSLCPLNAIADPRSENVSDCECFVGFYGLPGKDDQCYECSDGGVCNGGTEYPHADKGYWRSEVLLIYICFLLFFVCNLYG